MMRVTPPLIRNRWPFTVLPQAVFAASCLAVFATPALASVTDQGDSYLLSGSNYSLSVSKTNGSILSFKGTSTNDIATGGDAGLWSVAYTNDVTTNGLVEASTFSSDSPSNSFSASVVGDGLLLNYSNNLMAVAVVLSNRADGVDMSAAVTPGTGVRATELILPAKLRFDPATVQKFVAPSHSSDGVGVAYNANFFQIQTETNAATWESVAQADGGLGYRTIYGSGLVFTNYDPVAVSFTTEGETWLGASVASEWNNSATVVNRPPAAGQYDLLLVDSPNGPYFSGSHLGGGTNAGYLLRIGGNVNGTTAVDRSLDMVLAAADHLAQNPGGRSKVGVLVMERGPVIGESWPSEVRIDEWVDGLAARMPAGIEVVEIADMAELDAAAAGSDYLAILNPYGELVPASLSGGVVATVNTIRDYVHGGGNWFEVGGHPFFFALQPELYYSVELPYPAAFADFYQLETVHGNASLFGVQNVLTDPSDPWSTGNLFVPGNLSWGADAAGGYCERGFVTYVGAGETWQSPVVRLVAGYSAADALAQYASANGITRDLGDKMSASVIDDFKRSLLVRAYGNANELASLVDEIPSPAILHFTDYLKGGFDKEYPDHLPPNATNFGTPAEFLAFLAAAENAGIFTMPYTNPTLWNDDPRGPTFLAAGEAPLARKTDGSLAAEIYFGLPGYAATPWHPDTQAANRKTAGLFTPESPTNYPGETHYPVDFFFQDQVGARSWQYDLNPSAPSATAYVHGLAAIAAEDSLKLPGSTENGFDRLINFHAQFCGLAWGLVPTSGAPVWRRFLNERYDPATWTIFPLAQHLAHDKVAFTYNNLGAPVTNDEVVAWSMGLGYGMTYIIFNNSEMDEPAKREWLRWIDRLQKSVAARYIGEGISAFTHTRSSGNGDGSLGATYGPVTIEANLENANLVRGSRTLAPHGFVATAPGLVAGRVIEPGGSLPVNYVAETNGAGADIYIYSTGSRTVSIELPPGLDGSVIVSLDGAVPSFSTVSSNILTVTLPAGAQPSEAFLWEGSVTSAVATTVLVDFGPAATATTSPTNGYYWNNYTTTGTAISNLVTSTNGSSGWRLELSTAGVLGGGTWVPVTTTNMGVFNVGTAATDGLNLTAAQGVRGVRLSGLTNTELYTVGLYAGRDATQTRTTTYSVKGAGTNSSALTTSGTGIGASGVNYNNTSYLVFSNVAPDDTGSIYVEYAASAGDFGYLNALFLSQQVPVPSAPVITSATNASGEVSAPFSYQITATNDPAWYGASGLPDGLSVNTNSGLISGTPASITNAAVQISAANAVGTNTATLNMTIGPATIPVINSPTNVVMYGSTFRYQIATALSNAATYTASGLPPGVSLDAVTGLISGTLSSPVTGSFTVSAINSAGTNTITVDLAAYGQEMLIDFGQIPTTNAASGQVWNNWLMGGNVISNIVDSTGSSTGYFFEFITGVSWGTNFGVVPSSVFGVFNEESVVTDGLSTTPAASNGATFTISKLNPNNAYTLEILGSYNSTETRVTSYTVAGNATNTGSLTNSGTGIGGAVNFSTNTLTFSNVVPSRDGVISVNYRVSEGSAGYLNALRLSTTNYPDPASGYLSLANRWLDQEALAPLPTNGVVFVGSSSIRRWESLTRDFADYQVIQRGMGGATFADLNQLLDDVVVRHAPRAVVVWAGVNDLYAGRSGEYVFGQYTNFISTLTNTLPGTEILYIGITRNPVFDGNSAMNAQRTNANAMISNFAATNGNPRVRYVDLPAFFETLASTTNQATTNATDLWYYEVDHGHLNQRGYDVWKASIRSNLTAAGIYPDRATTVNPLAPYGGQRLLFDFGPADTTNGRATTGVDDNGNHWNNWHAVNGAARIVAGEHIGNLVDSEGEATGVSIRLTGDFTANGRLNGGLTNIPSLALGHLGTVTATEDYFYTTSDGVAGGGNDDPTGGLMVTGLNPNLAYDIRLFGSRDSSGTRQSSYQVIGAITNEAAVLQTSGSASGISGATGNNSTVATVSSVRPNAYGDIFIDVSAVAQADTANIVAYLNALEISAVSPYESWARSNGLTPGVDNSLYGINASGVPNLWHYAFDGDRNSSEVGDGKFRHGFSEFGGMPSVSVTMPVRYGAAFSGAGAQAAAIGGVEYEVQGSTNLVDWNIPVEAAPATDLTGMPALSMGGLAGYEYRTFRLSPSAGRDKGFIRAVVRPAPGSAEALAAGRAGLQAEDYAEASGITLEPGNVGIGNFDDGDWVKYSGVDFGNGATSATFTVAKSGSGGTVEIRLGSPTGRVIGTLAPQDTGGWSNYRDQFVQLSGFVSGVQDVYLVGVGATGICNIDSFRFSQYVLSWSDEFDGVTLNADNWSAVDNGDVANSELQFYTPRTNNVLVADGLLKLTAQRETYTGQGPWMSAPKTTAYTSGLVESLNKVEPQYGKIEARMRIPSGAGLWPAFWMLGVNYFEDGVGWPACGEIDIMEYSGSSGGFTAAFHTGAYNYLNGGGGVQNVQGFSVPNHDTEFHVYGIEWTPTRVAFYVDGNVVLTADKSVLGSTTAQWPFDQPFWLKLNLAVGGPYGGDPTSGEYPKTMEIDWVRVYQEPSE
jgi:beta-glucanase (GH16 family)/lysophospholipase L1-like esterase